MHFFDRDPVINHHDIQYFGSEHCRNPVQLPSDSLIFNLPNYLHGRLPTPPPHPRQQLDTRRDWPFGADGFLIPQ